MHLPLLSKRGAKEKEKKKERRRKGETKEEEEEKEERKRGGGKEKRNVSRGVPLLENVFKCRTSALSTIR